VQEQVSDSWNPYFVRRVLVTFFVLALLLGLTSAIPGASAADPAVPDGVVKAGVGVADATWNVGSSSGQYADSRDVGGELSGDGNMDPNFHTVKNEPSYGVQSRLSIRALVVEGADGKRVALVKADNYLAQDYLQRRVEQLLPADVEITRHEIVWSATHNHSSPYDLTPSAGVWAFQDAFSLRMFEYEARQAAAAITQAYRSREPVRMGATKVKHEIFKGNIVGPQLSDDGTPSGYPAKFGDTDLTVLRFDNIKDPAHPRPLATWVNWGQHPESLEGYNLLTADYLSALERNVDRATGSTMLFSQGDVGSSEGPYGDRAGREQLPDGVWREWAHMGFAQMERGAHYLSEDVLKAWRAIGDGAPGVVVPMSSNFEVGVAENWVPGPLSHPYPSVSNCRSETTVNGRPGAPVLGLPDCERSPVGPDAPIYEALKATGMPVPEHYDAPAYGGVEENNRIHLQAVRLGDVLLASCSCEAQVDLILNLKSRTDDEPSNIFDGYPTDELCAASGTDTYACEDLRTQNPDDRLTISKAAYDHMYAQIHNDAAGWDAPEYAAEANAEPTDPAKIKGNFTKQEIQDVCAPLVACGYKLPVGLGHTGDYDGYTVSYREYMARDSYRKALTSYGAHTADYMVTRLVKMAAALQGGPAVAPEPHDTLAQADEARQQAMAIALGQASSAAWDTWLASLPDDVGPAGPVAQPASIKRFGAATFTWVGGSNAIDNPHVTVQQRQADGSWADYADQSGEVQTFLSLPKGVASVADSRTGRQQWKWTANFEAFDPWPAGAAEQVANGTYRFSVAGHIQAGGQLGDYAFESEPFTVGAWDGIPVGAPTTLEDGRVGFPVGPVAYPRSYVSAAAPKFVRDDSRQVCMTCSFRPWASTSAVESVALTVTGAGGLERTLPTTFDAARGLWVTSRPLYTDETAVVAAGGVRDAFGETNGTPSAPVMGTVAAPSPGVDRAFRGGDSSAGKAASGRSGPARGSGSGGGIAGSLRNIGSVVGGLSALLVVLLIVALFAGVATGSDP
jgi:hypothetical protein